jgi:hypothetical protein
LPKTITETKVVNYRVDDVASVVARAIIGDAQEGAWTMHLGSRFLAGGTNADDVTVGPGRALAEGSGNLEVSAIVKDVRPETDHLTLTVTLTGGMDTQHVQITNLGNPGDSASYSIFVRFV